MTSPQKNDGARGYARGYEYFAMALSFTLAILLFGAGGWVLDGWVHTQPLFTILGAFVGGFAGFMRIYYRVKADTAAKKAAAGKTAADKTAADKTAADKTAADKTAADKTAADKTAADKTAADKTAAKGGEGRQQP